MNLGARLYLFLCLTLAIAGYTAFGHLSEQVSLSGFSAIETMHHELYPEHFVHDFPSGNVSGAKHAVITRLYAPLHALTGIPAIPLLGMMIALEILCVVGAAWVLWRTLIDDTQPALRIGIFCWLATVLLAGYVIRPNLSNFGYPFFHGQFYGFADAISMLAIAACLRQRWAWVAGLLCVGFMVHPTKILMASAFVAGSVLTGGRQCLNLRAIMAGLFTISFAALWGYFWLGLGEPPSTPIAPEAYIAYTRGWQYHWYPFDRGLLTQQHAGWLSPFLAVMLLCLLALRRGALHATHTQRWIGGMAMLALLTIAGLWFTYQHAHVLLIKLALIRASEPLVMLAAFPLLAAVYQHWQRAQWGWVALFAGILLAAMKTVTAFSLPVAVAAVLMHASQSKGTRVDRALLAAALVCAGGFIILCVRYDTPDIWHHARRWLPYAIAVLAACHPKLGGAMARRCRLQPAMLGWGAISLLFLLQAWLYLQQIYALPPEQLAKARDYRAAQDWAREHSATDALFMVDPCQAYGWREFSLRSSIGTPFEWFHTGWLYVSDGAVFARGQAIGRSLGLDFTDKLAARDEPAAHINYEVCAMAQEAFYDPSLKALRRMARDHGVSYFVMENQRSAPIMRTGRLQPVFANSHYRIFAAKDLP